MGNEWEINHSNLSIFTKKFLKKYPDKILFRRKIFIR